MKKFILPLLLLIAGIIVVVLVFVLPKNKNEAPSGVEDETAVKVIPFEKRPIVSLTPRSDGHWLDMKVQKLQVSADKLDYEFLYTLSDGRQQGVPGVIDIKGKGGVEEELLLGSESSGKFRYDEGVEKGSLILRFRDSKGKLVSKLETDFVFLENPESIESPDGSFKFTPDSEMKTGFFVVMNTLGMDNPPSSVKSGPFGIFTSVESSIKGSYTLGSLSENATIEDGMLIVAEL